MSKRSEFVARWGYRFIMVVSVIGVLFYMVKLLREKDTLFSTDENDPEEVRIARTQSRGMLTSISSAVFSTIVTVLMASTGVSQNGIEIMYGFLFSPVFGYLLDIGFATDTGLRLIKSNFMEWLKYTLSRLSGASFIRFVVTFLLDMYICKPLAAVFKAYSVFNLEKASWTGMLAFMDKFALKNVTSIVQSIIAVITFQTYTNQSRFLWAYPDKTIPKESRINSFSIMSLTSMAAVFYLSQYAKEVTNLSGHMFLAIFSFFLLSALFLSGNMDEEVVAPSATEKKKKEDVVEGYTDEPLYTNRGALIGGAVALFFFFVGVIYPFIFQRTSASESKETPSFSTAEELGKFMRKSITDPITSTVLELMNKEYELNK